LPKVLNSANFYSSYDW